jgi:uncharacterized membrane protein
MKPLIVLIITFLISLFIFQLNYGNYDFQMAGRIAMTLMLLFTSIAHFKFVKGMTMMVPEIIPNKELMVYVTGVLEITAAVCLLLNTTYVIASWFLIVFFIVLLPANINAAVKHIDYENGTYNGKGKAYLWFRIPLQLFFIIWVYFSSIYVCC